MDRLEMIEVTIDSSESPDGRTFKGVVVVNGNVTINGPIDFRGTIIATGDIDAEDGSVKILNDYDFIAKAMADCGETYLRGFVLSEYVWPTYSHKTRNAAASTDIENTRISEDGFVYVRVEQSNTGMLEKHDTIKDVVTAVNWRVREY